MARLARIVVPGSPHHIIQRGNNRQDMFFAEVDRLFYLRTPAERRQVAKVCMTRLAPAPMPALAYDMEDTANTAFAARPDRPYLAGGDGRIAGHGGPGPLRFKPDEFETAIRRQPGRE